MADRREPTAPFQEFCAALNRYDADYVVIGSEAVAFHGVPRFFMGRHALIVNKRASGRPKDLADVDLLTSDEPETPGT